MSTIQIAPLPGISTIEPKAREPEKLTLTFKTLTDFYGAAKLEGGGKLFLPMKDCEIFASTYFEMNYQAKPSDFGMPGTEQDIALIKMHYKIDGELQPFQVVGERDDETGTFKRTPGKTFIRPDAGDKLEFWFEIKDRNDNTYWHNSAGKVFEMNIVPLAKAVVSFNDDWSEVANQEPVDAVRLEYDLDRAAKIMKAYSGDSYGYYNGGNTLYAEAHIKFAKSPTKTLELNHWERDGVTPIVMAPTIEIPAGDKIERIWFEVHNRSGRSYDSDNGSDYRFPSSGSDSFGDID